MKFRLGISLLISILLVIAAKLTSHGALIDRHLQYGDGRHEVVASTNFPDTTSPTSQVVDDYGQHPVPEDDGYTTDMYVYEHAQNGTTSAPSTLLKNGSGKSNLVPPSEDVRTSQITAALLFSRQYLTKWKNMEKGKKPCRFGIDQNSTMLHQIDSLYGKITAAYDANVRTLEVIEKNGKYHNNTDVHDVHQIIKPIYNILQPVVQELGECIDPNSSRYYKTCLILPSKQIYGLFSIWNITKFQNLKRETNKKPSIVDLSTNLDKLVLSMIRMSNLCNASFLRNNNYLQYACGVLINIADHENLLKTLENGKSKNLIKVPDLEFDEKKWNQSSHQL